MPLCNAGDEPPSQRGRKSPIEIPLPKIGVLPGITLTEMAETSAMLIRVEAAPSYLLATSLKQGNHLVKDLSCGSRYRNQKRACVDLDSIR